MAEQGTVDDLKGLEQQLQTLFLRYVCKDCRGDSNGYCSSFWKLVEHYASFWKVPLPQLRVLERALCCFTQASAFFTVGTDHVLCTLSSLALSIFELLLFFDQKDFNQDPLRKITVTFQECCLSLARFQNVHLLQVERLLQAGGPWANQTLQSILSGSTLPHTEVEVCMSSESPILFELRVRYLLSCHRLPEAQALAKCCAQHHVVGQHLFFFQVYLTGLYKAAQHERLLEEVADFSGKDAVNFICSLESEENDDLLLGFSRVFLFQQLHRGDMHFLCDLVCLWGRLHRRLKTSKEALLKECEHLIRSATNVNAIFPFIRAIMQELSEEGVQFCMELCANALCSSPPCDVITKSLIYKTMASLVPNDLEICRACALLVFFLERSVEAYKMVYILYMHPDQEYHVDCCPMGNRVRFETLQTLKKDLYFDPEFWNLIALRTNCLKLINEKVLSSALEEIMEEKWVPNYCLKEAKLPSKRSKITKNNVLNKEKSIKGEQQNDKDTADKAPAKKVGRPRLNKLLPLKKGNQGSRRWKDAPSEPSRRSTFFQLDRIHCNRALDCRENRRTTRLSEKVPAKRTIKTPKWLLEDSGTLEKNSGIIKRQFPSFAYLPLRKRRVVVKNNSKDNMKPEEKLKENLTNDMKQRKDPPLDSQTASNAPQVVLELSLPDNELLGSFADEPCNRHRGLPQRLFYKPTLKVPSETKPANVSSEVILKAQDTASFILMLHSYGKKPKGKKAGANSQVLSSTLTHCSDQVNASNKVQLNDKPAVEMKVTISSPTHEVTETILRSSRENLHENCPVTRNMDTIIETTVIQATPLATVNKESTVEMEVTQKNSHSPRLEKTQHAEHFSSIVLNTAAQEMGKGQDESNSKTQEAIVANREVLVNGTPSQEDGFTSTENKRAQLSPTLKEPIAEANATDSQTPKDDVCSSCSTTVQTESKTETLQSQNKPTEAFNGDPVASNVKKDDLKSSSTSCPPPSTACDDDGFDPMEPQPECEESKLEFCCFFCHKDVKGRHLVAHAMFHYRKDECMFCGVAFKNNLKAMMHMSNHLEKLKKLQNPTANNSPKQSRAKATRKATVKTKTVLNEKKRGRKKKPLPTIRKLRSGYKFRERTKTEEEDGTKDLRMKDHVLKVNGHVGKRKKRKDIERIETSLIIQNRLRHRSHENHSNNKLKPVKIEREKPVVISGEQHLEEKVTCKASKQSDFNKNISPEEKLCCPVDGCYWFTVKKHAAFLYHVLENHYPDTKSLELAFQMGSNSCAICKRVLYSFEHFKHHVGRHISVPRHPCPHKGCTARFKTTIEMRRHARKHSPLQAVCCLPGCPKLFICQWALILHEKDHFSKRSKTMQSNDKPKSSQATVKQEDVLKKCMKSKDKDPPTSTDKPSKDTNRIPSSAVVKKDLSAQSAATRLLQRLRKRQITKNNLSPKKTLKMVSSVGKPNFKSRHLLQRSDNKTKQRLGCKVLPQRQAKSSQNVKMVMLRNESNPAKTSEVHTKLKEGKTVMDVGSKRKASTRTQRLTNPCATTMIAQKLSSRSRDLLKMSNGKRHIQKKPKKPAPESGIPVSDKNTNMDPTDTNDAFRNKRSLKDDSLNELMETKIPNNAEKVACQSEIYNKMLNPQTVDSEFVENVEVMDPHEEKVEDGAFVKTVSSNGETNLAAVVSEDVLPPAFQNVAEENMAKDNVENLVQENFMEASDSSENPPLTLSTIFNVNVAHEVMSENGAEECSNTVSSLNVPSKAPVMTILGQNVASPQNVERENVPIDHVFDPDETEVKADVKESVTMANAFGNTLEAANTEHFVSADDMSILEKLESTDLTANANTSRMEEETEGTAKNESVLSNGSSESSEPAASEKLFRPKFCNKNDILSALKTLVKSKNDKVKTKNEVKNSASKRKTEFVKMVSKKFKSEKQTAEDAAASVRDENEVRDAKDSPTSSSCSSHAALPNVKVTSKEKEGKSRKHRKESLSKNKQDIVKKQRAVQSKIQKKQRIDRINSVDKSSKKTKREKTDSKRTKTKSKERKEIKTSATPDVAAPEEIIARSNEVNIQSVPTEDNDQANNSKDHGSNEEIHVDKFETSSEIEYVKKPEDETCLKQREVFDLVPDEEENPLAAFEKALNEYKKRPYMRLPATAYLEEKFTVMPKRRKDMSMFFGSSRKVQTTPQPRQRCANCFSTFSSEDELQWHLQQKCSNLFGFDSDEEGTS